MILTGLLYVSYSKKGDLTFNLPSQYSFILFKESSEDALSTTIAIIGVIYLI